MKCASKKIFLTRELSWAGELKDCKSSEWCSLLFTKFEKVFSHSDTWKLILMIKTSKHSKKSGFSNDLTKQRSLIKKVRFNHFKLIRKNLISFIQYQICPSFDPIFPITMSLNPKEITFLHEKFISQAILEKHSQNKNSFSMKISCLVYLFFVAGKSWVRLLVGLWDKKIVVMELCV